MKENIKDYEDQLKQLCGNFVACRKCKDFTKLCIMKKLAFSMAKRKYKRDLKKGVINECS